MTPNYFARHRVIVTALVLGSSCIPLLPAAEKEEEPTEKGEQTSTSWDLKRQSSSTQSQTSSGGPLGNAVSPAASLFGAGELQILGYATGGYGQATHHITEEKTVRQTTTVYETHLETRTTFRRTFVPSRVGPGTFVLIPVRTRVPVTTKRQVTRNVKIKTTKNVAGTDGGFGGVGAEARYFLTNWLGVGVEGDWLEGDEQQRDDPGHVHRAASSATRTPFTVSAESARSSTVTTRRPSASSVSEWSTGWRPAPESSPMGPGCSAPSRMPRSSGPGFGSVSEMPFGSVRAFHAAAGRNSRSRYSAAMSSSSVMLSTLQNRMRSCLLPGSPCVQAISRLRIARMTWSSSRPIACLPGARRQWRTMKSKRWRAVAGGR